MADTFSEFNDKARKDPFVGPRWKKLSSDQRLLAYQRYNARTDEPLTVGKSGILDAVVSQAEQSTAYDRAQAETAAASAQIKAQQKRDQLNKQTEEHRTQRKTKDTAANSDVIDAARKGGTNAAISALSQAGVHLQNPQAQLSVATGPSPDPTFQVDMGNLSFYPSPYDSVYPGGKNITSDGFNGAASNAGIGAESVVGQLQQAMHNQGQGAATMSGAEAVSNIFRYDKDYITRIQLQLYEAGFYGPSVGKEELNTELGRAGPKTVMAWAGLIQATQARAMAKAPGATVSGTLAYYQHGGYGLNADQLKAAAGGTGGGPLTNTSDLKDTVKKASIAVLGHRISDQEAAQFASFFHGQETGAIHAKDANPTGITESAPSDPSSAAERWLRDKFFGEATQQDITNSATMALGVLGREGGGLLG